MFSAAGVFGRPGIVITSPVRATIKPAPEDNLTSLIGTSNPVGLPFNFGSVYREAGVLAIHTGNCPNP